MLDASVAVLWSLVIFLGVLVARKGRTAFRDAVEAAVAQLISLLPRIILALLLAGFIAKLLPTDLIGRNIGYDSGFLGVLIASVFGGVMPAGPMIAFPLVIVLRAADAG